MTENILKDNILYLQSWMKQNPHLQQYLKLEEKNLVYEDEKERKSIPIDKFYFPQMLYNETFRNKVTYDSTFSSKELFEIISLYVKAEEILAKDQLELQKNPTLLSLAIKNDGQKEFLVMIDSNHKKYRYDTNEPENVINIYNEIKNQQGFVTIRDLEKELQNGKHE